MVASRPPSPAVARFLAVARLSVYAALLAINVLIISTGIAWILFGNEGLPWVRMAVVGALLAALYVIVVLGIMVVITSPLVPGLAMNHPADDQETPTNADLVVR